MQNLYAFYVCKQANYECALDQIRLAFTPDTFTAPLNRQEKFANALALFQAHCQDAGAMNMARYKHDEQVQTIVEKAIGNYQDAMAQDIERLKNSWKMSAEKILRSQLYILQLLIAWANCSKRQTEHIKYNEQNEQNNAVFGRILAHNCILQTLHVNTSFSRLVQQHAIDWAEQIDLIQDWYNRFVKNAPLLQRGVVPSTKSAQDSALLAYLLQAIILKKEDIQGFFDDLDLNWIEHKQITKKMVLQTFAVLEKNTAKSVNLELIQAPTMWEEVSHFYTTLINTTLAYNEALDELISHHTSNWTIPRIVLLDKTILHLALCEMAHFANIPIAVSINEYLEISKTYSTPKSSQFINGILDAVSKTY